VNPAMAAEMKSFKPPHSRTDAKENFSKSFDDLLDTIISKNYEGKIDTNRFVTRHKKAEDISSSEKSFLFKLDAIIDKNANLPDGGDGDDEVFDSWTNTWQKDEEVKQLYEQERKNMTVNPILSTSELQKALDAEFIACLSDVDDGNEVHLKYIQTQKQRLLDANKQRPSCYGIRTPNIGSNQCGKRIKEEEKEPNYRVNADGQNVIHGTEMPVAECVVDPLVALPVTVVTPTNRRIKIKHQSYDPITY